MNFLWADDVELHPWYEGMEKVKATPSHFLKAIFGSVTKVIFDLNSGFLFNINFGRI